MNCVAAREALSAILDGERPAVDGDPLDEHLRRCPACRGWYDTATDLDRATRVAPAEETGPDLVGPVLDQVKLPRKGRWRVPLTVALLTVALVQLGIGIASLFSALGMHAGNAPSVHMDHETAAFNLAFGVAMVLVACNTRRARTQLPVLLSFVTVLAVASAVDLADGAVGWSRLATHAPVVLGLLLIAGLSRQPHADTGPASGMPGQQLRGFAGGPRHTEQKGDAEPRMVGRHFRDDPPPAAHRDAAHRDAA